MTIKIEGQYAEATIIERESDPTGEEEIIWSFTCSKGAWCPMAQKLSDGEFASDVKIDVIEWAENHVDQPHE